MKKILFIFVLFFISIISFGQTKKNNDVKNDDVIVSINVSKISRTLGKIVKATIDEVTLYRDEINENLIEPKRPQIDSIKSNLKYQAKDIHDKIHEGFVKGLRGETYP